MSKTILALKIQKQIKLETIDSDLKALYDEQTKISEALTSLKSKLDFKDLKSLAIIPELEISRMNYAIDIHQKIDTHHKTLKQLTHDIARLELDQLKIRTELKHIERYEEKKQEQQAIAEQNQSWNQLDEYCLHYE